MTREELFKEIKRKKSFLCVGLDSDPKKIPSLNPLMFFGRSVGKRIEKKLLSFDKHTYYLWLYLLKSIQY